MGARMDQRAALLDVRPAPLNLSDREMMDWLAEYCDKLMYSRPTPQYLGCVTIFFEEGKVAGETLREAVCRAAAFQRRANR